MHWRATFVACVAMACLTAGPLVAAPAPEEGRSVRTRAHSTRHWSRHGSTEKSHSYRRYSRWSRGTPKQAAPDVAPSQPPVPSATAAAVTPAPLTGPALVGIAVGGITSTSARVGTDIAAVLDSDDLRVLPLVTRSSLPDLLSLAALDRADLALLHADATAALPDVERARTSARLAYVARLYNEEVHILAATGLSDVRDLGGKKVNVGLPESDNARTATLIFERLGVVPNYVYLDQPTALAKLAAGELAADVLVSGRPVKALQDFAGDGRFRLMAIPYDAALQSTYLPARIEAADYGNLVPSGRGIDTLAVPIVLATVDAAAGTQRAARVARFTSALFEHFGALRDPARHPKWRDVNLAADVANWTRFPAAQDAIDRRTARSVGLTPKPDPVPAVER